MSETAYAQVAHTNGYEFTQGSGYALPEYPFQEPPELRSRQVVKHPIVIVGAGITGLTLACSLARLGVTAILIDEDNTVGVKGASSRGICYTQKSLEIFHKLGIYERIAQRGIQWSVGRTFAGQDEVYSFDLRQQGNFNLSSQPPFINIQQFYIEGYLVERIMALGHVDLRWQNRLNSIDPSGDCLRLEVQTPAGNYTIEAEHVIDASGSHSPLRQWLQVPATAKRGDDRWCIADVRFTKHPPVERHTWVEAPFNENRAVWQHLMADDVWRIDYQMAPYADPQEVSREDVVRERLARQFGPDTEVEVVWVGPYAYRSECVDHMIAKVASSRVYFMGDSAKVVSPFGARGGNTGVADADNLAWKLAAVMQGTAPLPLLDSYHDERHEAASQNVMVTNRTARFLRPADGMERTFRNAAIGLARQHLFARSLVNTGRMAVANSYTRSPLCGSSGGLSVQNVGFEWANGSPGQVNDLLQWAGARLLLLWFGEMSSPSAKRLRLLASQAPLRCVQVLGPKDRAQAVEQVRDAQGHLRQACHVFGHDWALLRPDGYLADTGESVDATLIGALEHALALAE